MVKRFSSTLLGGACIFFVNFSTGNAADQLDAPIVAMPPPAEAAPAALTPLDEATKDWAIRTNATYSDVVIDPNEHITDKVTQQLRLQQDKIVLPNVLYVSGYAKASYMRETTSTKDAFPILTRFPDHASGTSADGFFVDNLMLGLTYAPTDWITGYAQVEYHENHFDSQDPVQLRKAYVTLGKLDTLPLYLTVGRKTINFGTFDQYSPFTHSVSNHFFRAESDGPVAEIGYVTDNINVAFSGISAGRQTRTADMAGDGFFNNFALNGDYAFDLSPGYRLSVGAGYLHGTIYNHTLPHHPSAEIDCPVGHGQQGVPKCRGRNGAFDLRAELNSELFDLQVEYTSTVDPWLATGELLETFTAQGRYKTQFFGYDTNLSAAYSFANIGPFSMGGPGSPTFDSLDSIVLGGELFLHPNMSLAAEYSHNTGFAPLINVTDAAKDASSDQFAAGLRVSF